MTIRTATGLIAAYMRLKTRLDSGESLAASMLHVANAPYLGWASFWNSIYVLPGHDGKKGFAFLS